MQDFEKLGAFYLGREYDLEAKAPRGNLVLYDSKDLLTHAVIVGMTGSGKTGLAIGLLEEAAIDGIPAIVIDPKGDLGNLLLAFPELRAEDFAPWINPDDARRRGMDPDAYAAAQARLWRDGLEQWGQTPDRVRRMREAAEFTIYTPGSDAGEPVSLLKSFAAPPEAVIEDRELLRERVTATAASLLALLGVNADPVQSRENTLLARILDAAWKQGRALDLAALIHQIQTPPFDRVGVMDLESFYPARQRFDLAMSLNGLLASPGFEAWLEGEPLDIGRFLYSAHGKPRVSIFSIAHLDDAARMFFVALLLNQVVSWMRTQSGTTSLRAILYMDEIFGYLPPVANPPSKLPLLTLLKQARAFGLGVVLATQNPVDLDYKALSNAGTWFVGRLQTERDKARLLDGLEGAAAGAGFDRRSTERALSALGSRIFLLNNVHEDAPVVFESRWALSYLRGPLTRSQIRQLARARRAEAPTAESSATVPEPPPVAKGGPRPVLPPEIPQYFVPPRGMGRPVYQPMLLGSAQVRILEEKAGVDVTKEVLVLTPFEDGAVAVRWENASEAEFGLDELEREPRPEAAFANPPRAAGKAANYKDWSRELANWLYANEKVELFRSPSLAETSQPGESERDFRIRLQQRAREERDREVARLRQRYAPRLASLEDRLRRARQALAREQEQARSQQLQTAVSIGSTLLGALFGRKMMSSANVGRAGTALRSMSRARKEAGDVQRAGETIEALEQQLAELQAEIEAETGRLTAAMDPMAEPFEPLVIRPKKTGIQVRFTGLAWAPRT